ncbi:glycosyltransferase BC10-like [Phragmites australis]|uniref:glycosyltransferase BC10-like n=1 Tax=Phragmites australis TaxID=29695 RepID=UPI002D78A48B|nr:glycosyltransferase BC10-like [Phragmites australis]
MHGTAVVDGDGKDGAPNPTRMPQSSRTTLPLKLLRPLLLFAVLATGFFAAVLLLLGSSTYSVVPRLSVPDALSAAPSRQRSPACARDEEVVLERWTRAPASAWHNMSDEELLWAASWQPRVRRYPYRRVPKVAFMFLTRGPLPLAPLWERFFAGADRELYSVYVHATPGYRPDFPATSVFYRRQVPSQEARWGDTTMCDAERRLLANALLDAGNERFVLVSESCVPLYGFPVVYHYLTRSHHSFVGAFDDPGPHGRGRYRAGLAPEVRPDQWRKGAQWFELDRALAVDVVADGRYYPKFREHCRPPCYPDEHYLPTVLSVEAPGRIANHSVTWVDWSRGGAHPATFGGTDVGEAFLRRLTTTEQRLGQRPCLYNGQPAEVCFLFARKFAPSALQPLLSLAPKMLGYG